MGTWVFESRAAIQKMENSHESSVKCLARVVAEHPGGGQRVQLCRQSSILLSRLSSRSPASLLASVANGGRGFKTAAASVPAALFHTGRGEDPWRK